MKKFFYRRPEVMLIAIAIFFLAFLIFAFSWVMGEVTGSVNMAVNTNDGSSQPVQFNIDQAKQLDWRGLVK